MRLLARIDAADEADPKITREHLSARLADLYDAIAAVLHLPQPEDRTRQDVFCLQVSIPPQNRNAM